MILGSPLSSGDGLPATDFSSALTHLVILALTLTMHDTSGL